MDIKKVQQIYDAVLEQLQNMGAPAQFPGYDELYDFIVSYRRELIAELRLSTSPTYVAALENTLYLGIVVGLVYNQLHGVPDWALPYLNCNKDGECSMQDMQRGG